MLFLEQLKEYAKIYEQLVSNHANTIVILDNWSLGGVSNLYLLSESPQKDHITILLMYNNQKHVNVFKQVAVS